VLDDAILDRLKLVCALLRDAEKWQAQGVSIPRSLLLAGSSGVGKTQVARTLANESGLTFIAATTADVKAIHAFCFTASFGGNLRANSHRC